MRRLLNPFKKYLRNQENRFFDSSVFSDVPKLENKHLKNCRVLAERYDILRHMPKGGRVAEVGVLGGDFSIFILQETTPEHLFLVDTFCSDDWSSYTEKRFRADNHFRFIQDRFQKEIGEQRIELIQGLSQDKLAQIPAQSLDWIYIDADHSYEAVSSDLNQAHRLVRPGGFIVMNDYIFFSHHEKISYGVVHAVNEFCIRENYELLYLALHPQMYCDVVLRSIASEELS